MKQKPHEEEPEEQIEVDDDVELADTWLFGMFADLGMMGPEPEEEDN